MNKRIFFIAAICMSCFNACQKTVVLNLNNAAAQIVIQGLVTNNAGPYTVSISQSVGFYADNVFPPVTGAIVKISDGNGVTDTLTETAPGTYTTHKLQGVPGRTYSLSVFAQNNTYTASSAMPLPVTLDSVTFQTSNGVGKKHVSAVANFQDPAGIKNYYQFIQYINGQQFTKNIYVFDDRLSDGKHITNTLRMDSAYMKTGDALRVTMNCIDANVYNYFYELSQSSGTGTFNSSASPSDPDSNITNGALGYFSAQTTQTKAVVVP
jgi:hypothetical protein